jgi:hypothetical protein
MPYSLFPQYGITEKQGSRCKIVYVCRDPKGVLVSPTVLLELQQQDGSDLSRRYRRWRPPGRTCSRRRTYDEFPGETFEHFCEGRSSGGPRWLHVLEYWHESQKRSSEVLFFRYEDILGDPAGNLKKLAAFMGCVDHQLSSGFKLKHDKFVEMTMSRSNI